jgi:hypothetical protein
VHSLKIKTSFESSFEYYNRDKQPSLKYLGQSKSSEGGTLFPQGEV